MHGSLLHYAHAFLNQATRTAVANGRSKIEERLARWLLMAHDRVRSPELPLTHESLVDARRAAAWGDELQFNSWNVRE